MLRGAILRYSILLVILALAGCEGGWYKGASDDDRLTSSAATMESKNARRPFYLIGHNPNAPKKAIEFLRRGANAIEPDLRYVKPIIYVYDQIPPIFGMRIPWPPPIFRKVFTLEEYLAALSGELDNHRDLNLSLIAWDLKPPFEDDWMLRAVDVIRKNFSPKHPDVAMLYTVGSSDGIPALQKIGTYLRGGEAVGVDAYASPDKVQRALRSASRFTYARGMDVGSIDEAVVMRDGGKSFSMVYVWGVSGAHRMEHILRKRVDAMIVDDICTLRGILASPEFEDKFRLAVPTDQPFGKPGDSSLPRGESR